MGRSARRSALPLIAVVALVGGIIVFRDRRSGEALPPTFRHILSNILPPEEEENAGAKRASEESPAHVESVPGTDLKRIMLTARAAERLGITTVPVRSSGDPRTGGQKELPYAAVLYDTHGETWTYTNPEPLVFIRQRIEVDFIEGDRAVLSDGPPVGTAVVTAGAAELFGIEFGIGK